MISGYIIDIIVTLFFFIGNFQDAVPTNNFFRANVVVQWYGTFYIGPWNTVMVFNRFSAIVFYSTHDNLWKGWKLWGILFGYMITPFIIEGYLFSNLYCFTVVSLDKNCVAYAGEQQTVRFTRWSVEKSKTSSTGVGFYKDPRAHIFRVNQQ
uniref:Uncharacterized protein n=1 Tax=Panagrolaimus davidi TaxID=227884 RepID=A0A914PWW0_9BILA